MGSLNGNKNGLLPSLDGMKTIEVDTLNVSDLTVSNITASNSITAYSSDSITPSQGQMGDTYTLNTTTARTLTTSLLPVISYTFNRGVGVYLVRGHLRYSVASGTSMCGLLLTLNIGPDSHFYYNVIPENTSGSALSHTIQFGKLFIPTTSDDVSITVSTILQNTLASGSVTVAGTSDTRYSAFQIVRIA